MFRQIGPTLAKQWRIAVAIVAGLAVAAVLANVFLSFQAAGAAKRIVAVFADTARVEFQNPRANWSGDIVVTGLRITPLAPPRGATLVADRATLHTPGFTWIARAAMGRQGAPLPAAPTLGLTLEGVGVEGSGGWLTSADWLGVASAAPFEALGCNDSRRFDAADFDTMGLAVSPGRVEARYRAETGDTGELVVGLSVPGSSHAEHRRVFRMADPARPLSTQTSDVALLEQTWAIRDDGFVQARNRRCAQRARLTRSQFVERHLRLLDRWLAARGLVASRELVGEYGYYAAHGGVLKWRSIPSSPRTLAQLQRMPPAARMTALNAAFVASGRQAVAFRFAEYVPPIAASTETTPGAVNGSQASPSMAAAATTAVTAPVTPSTAIEATPQQAQAPPAAAAITAATAPAASVKESAAAPSPPVPPPAAADTPRKTKAATAATATPSPAQPAAPDAAAPDTAAPDTAAPDAATPAATAAKPHKNAVRIPVVRPGPVEYEQLEHAAGRSVAIQTVYGTRRVGTLMNYSRRALTIRLSMREGGVLLTVPRETIARLELLDLN